MLSFSGVFIGCQSVPGKPTIAVPTVPQYRVYSSASATIHTLLMPSTRQYTVVPAVSSEVLRVAEFARQRQAIAVLNGGFFDPINQRSTSYVTIAGKLVEDPRMNARLMENIDLKPYLPQILNRSEFRQYRCADQVHFDIVRKQDPTLKNCQLLSALGAGPQLLPTLTAELEGFWLQRNGAVLRDPLGMQQRNARTAVGITGKGEMVWAMAAQKSPGGGLTLPELARFLQSLGVEKALNLDGGTSSALYYQGKTIYGKVDEQGQPTGRPVKSVLILKKNSIP
jgi:hypothetical protein